MTTPGAVLDLSRASILAHRRRAGALDARLPRTDTSLRRAAWAGLTDSMPRAAVFSLHARVTGVTSSDWEHPAFVQLWGPRFCAYVVHHEDRAVFSLGRWPADVARQQHAVELADRLEAFLDRREVRTGDAGRAIGVHPSQLRYAATTGRLLIRWDGARQPTVRMARPPTITPTEARRELLRRYLHVLGPGSADGFASWAGLKPRSARSAFEDLEGELTPVRTPIGEGWVLTVDEPSFRAGVPSARPVRLLPSGDAYYLLHGRERELLVPDPAHRPLLWTSRVWPGAVLVGSDVLGTWRRAERTITVGLWERVPPGTRGEIEAEAAALPVPGADGDLRLRWAPLT